MNRRSFLSMIGLAPVAAFVAANSSPVIRRIVPTTWTAIGNIQHFGITPSASISLDLDGSAYLVALDELESLAPSLPEGVRQFLVSVFDTPDLSSQLGVIEQDEHFALGARELRIRLQPSDRLLMLLAAMRAGDCDLHRVQQIFGHDSVSVVGLDNCNEGDVPGESQGSPGTRPLDSQRG
jgi:hypothetical protein